MAILLALGAAVSYGISDFVAGVASRRTSAWPVAVLSASTGALAALVLTFWVPGEPGTADLLWGALAGIGSGTGASFLYRGLALGRMGVVGPVSAVGAAGLPVLVGLLGGERPTLLVWTGITLALPAIWLVAREPRAGGASAGVADGLVDGLLAGAGFGLLFAALGQVPEDAGYGPVLLSQLVGVGAVIGLATAMRQAWVPRHRSQVVGGVGSGILSVAAVTGFLLATQQGLLAVSAVLASLYPAVTVLLARALLREHIHRVQGAGLALCAVSVVCVALG